MANILKYFFCAIILSICFEINAEENEQDLEATANALEKPLYNPFIERYIIDELKQLRIEQQNIRVEFHKELTDRQLRLAEISATYATDTITYFFYIIAATSSALLLIGWNSLRDVRANIEGHAETKISKLIADYETRLDQLEQNLILKSAVIEANQAQIETTNEIQALWVKANQESAWEQKIKIYDHILELKPESTEAMTYKADAAIEIGQPQQAIALCNKALEIEQDNGHAYFQLACAYADLQAFEIAYDYLVKAINISEDYRSHLAEEPRFQSNKKIMSLLEVSKS